MGHAGVGRIIQGLGGSCREGVGTTGVEWVMQGWGGVGMGWIIKWWGQVGHTEVGWGGS